jgi:hypothetical protein
MSWKDLQCPFIVITWWFNFIVQSERKGQLGRIRSRRKNNIKRDTKEIGLVWIKFVWLRIKRVSFVLSAVINCV